MDANLMKPVIANHIAIGAQNLIIINDPAMVPATSKATDCTADYKGRAVLSNA